MNIKYVNIKMSVNIFLFVLISLTFNRSLCYKHKLNITDDHRSSILLTTFGFYEKGYLNFEFNNFNAPTNTNSKFGFRLVRVVSDSMGADVAKEECLSNEKNPFPHPDIILFVFDFNEKKLKVSCNSTNKLSFYDNITSIPSDGYEEQNKSGTPEKPGKLCSNLTFPVDHHNSSSKQTYNTTFVMYVPTAKEEGLYFLYFYNCRDGDDPVSVSFNVRIEAKNYGNYLSAGEMPLPRMYFFLAVIFYLAACVWIYLLVRTRHPVFKIHYLMAVLAVLKSMTLLLHGINYKYLESEGEHVSPWIILFYILYLLKGLLLFITIILIGAGWTFIKHILSKKDKKIFMLVLPLQVFANIAKIIIEECEQGDASYKYWFTLFVCIDLICCFSIIFPVIWSINHLQAASHVDGKAAFNLRVLKLFRSFYVMVACYIYFTRMVSYLLQATATFQNLWLEELFKECTTLVFFILTGYKFRPASANPYFPLFKDPNEMSTVVPHYDVNEGLKRLHKISNETGEEDKDTLIVYERGGA